MCVSPGHFFFFAGKVVEIMPTRSFAGLRAKGSPLPCCPETNLGRGWDRSQPPALLCCPLVSPLRHCPQPKVAAGDCDLYCLPHSHKNEHEQFLPVASENTDTTERLKYSFISIFYDGF